MERLTVNLTSDEIAALQLAAERDLRDLRGQARYLIIRGLAAERAAKNAQPVNAQPAEGCDNARAA